MRPKNTPRTARLAGRPFVALHGGARYTAVRCGKVRYGTVQCGTGAAAPPPAPPTLRKGEAARPPRAVGQSVRAHAVPSPRAARGTYPARGGPRLRARVYAGARGGARPRGTVQDSQFTVQDRTRQDWKGPRPRPRPQIGPWLNLYSPGQNRTGPRCTAPCPFARALSCTPHRPPTRARVRTPLTMLTNCCLTQ